MGFVREMDALARQFLWAGSLMSSKWSPIKWDTICCPKQYGGLGLRQSPLVGEALEAKLYW